MADSNNIPHIVLVAENGDQTTGEAARAASSIAGDLIGAYLGTTYHLGMGQAGPSLRIGEPVGSGPGTVGGCGRDVRRIHHGVEPAQQSDDLRGPK